MKDIIYMESAILRNNIINERQPYEVWIVNRKDVEKYLYDNFKDDYIKCIEKYNEEPIIKRLIDKLKNIIDMGDQEIFNDTIEYYKGELEKELRELEKELIITSVPTGEY